MTATNAVGTSPASAASAAVTPTAAPTVPGVPTAVSATAGDAQATVSFTAPASNGGSAITGYTATSSPGGKTATGASSPLTVTGLTDGTSYTFTVTATNAVGTSPASAASAAVTPTAAPTVPGVPTAVSATAGDAQATVSFTAPASNGGSAITGYTATSSPGGKTATGASGPLTVTGLTDGTSYTFTVTATNAVGTSPASAASAAVTPQAAATQPRLGPTVTDNDGNVYHTDTIGSQVWMVENLKTTKYNDGSTIPLVTDNTAWATLTTPGYCWYNDSISYGNTYGALYNWYSVNTGKLAPKGWHVPTDSEWEVLGNYLGGDNVAGGPLKEAGTTHWLSPNTGATNTIGFSALPGGFRYSNGSFVNVGSDGLWWSSTADDATNSWGRTMNYDGAFVYRNLNLNVAGYSVRCVRDH